jgi:isoquinoline 1-oxidoreductase subunit beta
LPLRHLCPYSRCYQARRPVGHQRTEGLIIILDRFPGGAQGDVKARPQLGLSRRTVLTAGLAAGGGLFLSVSFPNSIGNAEAVGENFSPNAFVRIARDGQVTLIMNQVEMGQGTYTSMPMLIAEELEVDLRQVRIEHAPPDDKLYANPLLGFQVTGGSTSVRGFWKPLRIAGAAARMMLVSAAAQTWKVDAASCHAEKGAVIHAATGRKLAYGALVAQAAKQAVPANIPLKDPKDFKLIGTSAKRTDTPHKVNGTAEFGIDTKVPGMKIATVAACPVIGGKLASVDDAKAKAVKGVVQIVRLDNAVAVIADHMGAAKKGLGALVVKWDDGANASFSSADLVQQLKDASSRQGVVAVKEGDTAKAIAGSATKFEAIYQMPLLAHAAMEPMNCTVHVRKDGCDVWVGTQVAARAQATAAEVTGLPLDKVKVHNHLLGGGFGRRLEVDGITQAVQIAKQVDFPVKVIWTREEDIQHDVYRPYYYDQLSAGLDAKGFPVAFNHRVVGSSILARWAPPFFKDGLDSDAVENATGPYAFANVLVDYVRQEPPQGLTTGWWRGVGMTHNAFMVEGFIDELAALAKKDPVDYRRALLDKTPRARAVLDLVADKAGWGRPLPTGTGRGVSVVFGFGSYIAQVAEVSVGKDGQVKVQRIVCAVDCGRMINPDTIRAQMEGGIIFGLTAALYGKITIKDGRVEQGNFDSYQALRINETPTIEVHLVDSGEEPGGIGEPGTATIAPAVVNAIFALTGKRFRKLPIDPAELKST